MRGRWADTGKIVEQQALCSSQPLPLDTLGAWGESTVKEVRKIGSALARQTGGEEGEVIRHLVQRISVILMRINSNLILNRGHNLNQPQIDGIE